MFDLENIRTTFAFFDDWEDKYRFLIDLGKSVPALPTQFRVADNLVRGCQSQVWLLGDYDTQHDQLKLQIDSDAHIVRGLIAIVLATYDRRSPNEIVAFTGSNDYFALIMNAPDTSADELLNGLLKQR